MIHEVKKIEKAFSDIKNALEVEQNTPIEELADIIKERQVIEEHRGYFTAIIFQRSNSQPELPEGGIFNPCGEILFTPPDGWSLDASTNYSEENPGKVWMSSSIFWNIDGVSNHTVWSNPTRISGIDGVDGLNGTSGRDGINGVDGTSITIKNTVNTVADLPLSGNTGDAYIVKDGETAGVEWHNHLFVWSGGSWEDMGQFTGDDGDTIIQAFAFYRSNSPTYDAELPSGGTFAAPYPTTPAGWSDGMPEISEGTYVYFSKTLFQASNPEPVSTTWTTPTRLGDSESVDYEYNCLEEVGIPIKSNPSDDSVYTYIYNEDYTGTTLVETGGYCDSRGWFDETPDVEGISEKIKWMATCKVHNNEFYKDSEENPNWILNNIKGETGPQGEQGETGEQGPEGPQGPQGETGEPGTNGKVTYPAGEWEAKVYEQTDTATPYVTYNTKYYVLNSESASENDEPGVSDVWKEMESFKAIYTKLLIADGGNLGKFYFYGDYMFSEDGVVGYFGTRTTSFTVDNVEETEFVYDSYDETADCYVWKSNPIHLDYKYVYTKNYLLSYGNLVYLNAELTEELDSIGDVYSDTGFIEHKDSAVNVFDKASYKIIPDGDFSDVDPGTYYFAPNLCMNNKTGYIFSRLGKIGGAQIGASSLIYSKSYNIGTPSITREKFSIGDRNNPGLDLNFQRTIGTASNVTNYNATLNSDGLNLHYARLRLVPPIMRDLNVTADNITRSDRGRNYQAVWGRYYTTEEPPFEIQISTTGPTETLENNIITFVTEGGDKGVWIGNTKIA